MKNVLVKPFLGSVNQNGIDTHTTKECSLFTEKGATVKTKVKLWNTSMVSLRYSSVRRVTENLEPCQVPSTNQRTQARERSDPRMGCSRSPISLNHEGVGLNLWIGSTEMVFIKEENTTIHVGMTIQVFNQRDPVKIHGGFAQIVSTFYQFDLTHVLVQECIWVAQHIRKHNNLWIKEKVSLKGNEIVMHSEQLQSLIAPSSKTFQQIYTRRLKLQALSRCITYIEFLEHQTHQKGLFFPEHLNFSKGNIRPRNCSRLNFNYKGERTTWTGVRYDLCRTDTRRV